MVRSRIETKTKIDYRMDQFYRGDCKQAPEFASEQGILMKESRQSGRCVICMYNIMTVGT